MSGHRVRTLTRWAMQVVPGILICMVVLFARPSDEWPAIGGPLLLFFVVVIGFAAWVAHDRRVDATLRTAGTVAFTTQNVPGAIVHLERFLVVDATFARGPSFVIVADDTGLGYYSRGKNTEAFVRIPWSDIDGVAASGGDLVVTLADGNLLMHIPGGLLPMGARRVRALAGEISALQRARQP